MCTVKASARMRCQCNTNIKIEGKKWAAIFTEKRGYMYHGGGGDLGVPGEGEGGGLLITAPGIVSIKVPSPPTPHPPLSLFSFCSEFPSLCA
jgi:hypothetical protein